MYCLRAVALFLLVILCAPVSASSVENQLLSDIKRSKQRLHAMEKQQLKARKQLAGQLSTLEMTVEQLRDEVGDVQRLEDEKTLALDELKARLQTWQRQDAYQRHAITQYLKAIHVEHNGQMPDLLLGIQQAIAGLEQRLTPTWKDGNAVSQSGQLLAAKILRLGSIAWMFDPGTGQAGLLSLSGEIPEVQLAFNSEQSAALARIYQQGVGDIYFDPTLGRVAKLSTQQDSAIEHVKKGGVWTIPILLCALVALLCALVKAWQLYRLPKVRASAAGRLRPALQSGDMKLLKHELEQSTAAEASIVDICQQYPDPSTREDALFAYLMQRRGQLEKWLGAVAVIAAVAPLLGLLGTVSGMIRTFKMMTLFGSGDASAVSGGISEALVTTELGLIVAIPALLLHALLSRWVKQRQEQEEGLAIALCQMPLTKKHGEAS